jgi:hypothetical protein
MASRILSVQNLLTPKQNYTSVHNHNHHNHQQQQQQQQQQSSSSTSNNTTFSSSSSSSSIIADSSINSSSNSTFNWTLGLINNEGKYLTAENFGFKINATGNTLRKKQKWSIEQDANDQDCIYLKSPLGCYLSTDKYGKLYCEKTTPNFDSMFIVETNGQGKWSFRSQQYGYYFGGTADRLHCFSKTQEWWTVHLAIHPQVLQKLIQLFRFRFLIYKRKKYFYNQRDISLDRENNSLPR